MPKVLFKYRYIFLFYAAAMLFFASCSPTKHVPRGQKLLVENKIVEVPHAEASVNASPTIRQKPNRSISIPIFGWVLWRPYLQIYNLGDPKKEKGFKHYLTEIGEAPVILDSMQTMNSASQIGAYYFKKGFFLNEVEFVIEDANRRGTKAKVTYTVYTGPQYYFNNLEYIISSPGILGVVQQVRSETKIKSGSRYDEEMLEEERNRLVKVLRDNGYYGFQKAWVRIEADTSAGDHNVNLKLFVSDIPIVQGDSTYYVEHIPYRIKNVYFDPNHNFAEGQKTPEDTLLYEGVTLLREKDPNYKPYFLESLVHYKPGELYNESSVRESYSHITGSRIFQSAELTFEVVPGDSTNALNAFIKAQPYKLQNFNTNVEVSTTAGNYGVSGLVGYGLKNVFKAGEVLDFSVKGGFEAQVALSEGNDQIFNTREIGFETGLNFPRFFLFSGINKKIPKRMEPKSRLFTSFNYQTRIEFERSIFKVGLLYTWKESETKFHQLNVVDINYVFLPRIDQDYYNSLEFKTGFQDNLIMAIRYTFLYDNQKVRGIKDHQFLRTSIETSGNILDAINGQGRFAYDAENQQYTLFGVPYAQYIKLDADFRYYYKLPYTNQIVSRIYAGSTFNYGNSPFFPPFEKSFLAGGSNDIRGWTAYRLGPGNFPKALYSAGTSGYASVGPLKLMANLEYRFPIVGSIRGALFFDAGNIWLWDKDYGSSNLSEVELALVNEGVFKWNRFYKQIALNTGLGIRYDFGFFALRVDLGIKVYDPTEGQGNRYVLGGTRWNNIVYNIALGYPF